ncbi:MAG TPA: ATP synthase F1 subunit delta [Candidatus Omnitrophota bacterium]|nr:ATP synthase F1 subunit delta [Candidatus Omnitrophota bacterium]
MNEQAARRYAQALFDLGQETKELDTIQRDLGMVKEAIGVSQEFNAFLFNPVIPKGKQQSILEEIFKKKIHAPTLHFLFFLVEKGRLGLLKEICALFEGLYLEFKNVGKVRIVTSVALNSHQEGAIKNHLKDELKKEIQADIFVDPKIMGGLKVHIGDEIHDYTIQTQLEEFRQNFLKTG